MVTNSPGGGPYTGHVDQRGEPSTRSLDDTRITKLSVGPMDNNAYLLVCKNTGDAVLIDAADDAGRILDLVRSAPGQPRLGVVVTTHAHHDHWQALAEVIAATGSASLAGTADAQGLPVATGTTLEHGDTVPLGDCTLEVIGLRGHTPGSVALRYADPTGTSHLFTGDSLFPGGPGRTTSPQDFTSLINDLEDRVFTQFDDDTWVYPGHGDDTTLGAERPHLQEWRSRGW